MVMMAIFIPSPTPSTRIAAGISATGGIARRNSTTGALARRATGEMPRRSPPPIPIATASAKPAASRARLGTRSVPTRSNSQVSANVLRMSDSGGK